MTKKGKKGTAPAKTTLPRTTVTTSTPQSAPTAGTHFREQTPKSTSSESSPTSPNSFFINFKDWRVRWYLYVVIGLFVGCTLLKFHNVSLAIWNQILPDGAPAERGLVSGQARQIRMDDYAVSVPWLLSNVNQGLPLVNEVVGGEEIGLLMLPNHHIFMLFKPTYWGFLFLDTERAVSWMYNLNATSVLISTFLLFLLLTQNNVLVSMTGSIWLWLSSGSQSWVGGPSVAISFFAIMIISGIYLLFSEKRSWGRWALWSFLFSWSLFSAVFLLYPPYQVPLGYGFLLVFLGFLVNNIRRDSLQYQLGLKIGVGLLGVLVLGGVMYRVYQDLKPTLDAVTGTVYPGKRSDGGGGGFIANYFSEYFSWLYSDSKFPNGWLNHCELSHYLTFIPVIIPTAIASFVLNRRVDWMITLLMGFVIALLIWMQVGWPQWLADATLMSMSPTRRTQIPLGVISVVLTVVYLNYIQNKTRETSTLVNAGLVIAVLGYMIYAAYVNINDGAGFFKSYQLFVPVLFFAFLNSLLLFTIRFQYKIAVFCVGLILFLLPNLKINPWAVGLSPITDHTLYKTVREIGAKDPNARWVVMGSQYLSYMTTATGVKLISGVKFIPERKIMKVLDPQARRDSVYNRYAHTVYNTYIDGKDSVIFQNPFEDGYNVGIDPCSPKLKALNVKYLIFDREPQAVEIRCMKLINTLGSIRIYQRTDL
ncbi:DUF7657 domain-containing protein [Spirosoma flavum]|uniref:Glycosyltransferase RgtA/B/C/D-like domain-containing protein n=1 Tax=Spirosoma flavum TaxID=2048557 RepID=A0ABW6AU91_9BACT